MYTEVEQAEAVLTHFWSLPPHHTLPYEVQEEHVLPQELTPLVEQSEVYEAVQEETGQVEPLTTQVWAVQNEMGGRKCRVGKRGE